MRWAYLGGWLLPQGDVRLADTGRHVRTHSAVIHLSVTSLAALALWPLWSTDRPLANSLTALVGALLGWSVFLFHNPRQLPSACALAASAVGVVLTWADRWDVGPWPAVSIAVGNVWWLLLVWAAYRIPRYRLTSVDRRLFQVFSAWCVAVPASVVVASRPQWLGYSADVWWPASSWAAPSVVPGLLLLDHVGLMALTVTALGRWLFEYRRLPPARRRMSGAVAAAVAVAGLVSLGSMTAQTIGARRSMVDALAVGQAYAVVAVAVVFLAVVARRRLARAGVIRLIQLMQARPSLEGARHALRAALRDTDLDIVYVGETASPVSADRSPGPSGPSLLRTMVRDADGRPLASILTDAMRPSDPALLDAAAAIVGLSLETARLVETVQQQSASVLEAVGRALLAAEAERRRLEHDLHDGAQQHLLALGPMIGAVQARTNDPTTKQELEEIRRLLCRALRELREFTQGKYPSALAQGLRDGVMDLCRRLPLDWTVDLPDVDVPPEISHAAYLLFSEALSNVVKHARASRVTLVGVLEPAPQVPALLQCPPGPQVLILEVSDDGIGGAVEGTGRGLQGMRDRVLALGGRLHVHSPPGCGTRIIMELPCR